MRPAFLLALSLATLSLPTLAAEPNPTVSLMQKNGCFACHDVQQKVIGPAYREVANRYTGDAAAPATLLAKIKHGGSGVWGTAGMPPQSHLKDDEIRAMIEWVLSQKS